MKIIIISVKQLVNLICFVYSAEAKVPNPWFDGQSFFIYLGQFSTIFLKAKPKFLNTIKKAI